MNPFAAIPRIAALAAVSTVVAVSTVAEPAQAATGITCPDATRQIFLPWNDLANYSIAPDGGFESGASGWTLRGGAAVVAGNESFHVRSAVDRRALALPSGSSATSPRMCIGLLSGKMRFFATDATGSAARLKVEVLYEGGLGGLLGSVGRTLGVSETGVFRAPATWQPSPAIAMLGGVVPLFTDSVRFRFTPLDSAGDLRIDDVYLDPLRHG